MSVIVDPRDTIREQALYRAVWRWHFIAGLIVLPVLVMMAITGGLYLFKPELDHAIYRALEDVPVRTDAPAPASVLVASAEAATGGKVLQIILPARPDRSARLIVRAPSGEALTTFVDPYAGAFLGATHYGGLMQTIRKMHSLQKFGFWASTLVEITAGWTVVLIVTGLFLWWPRGRAGGIATVRGRPESRVFWRDLHAVTGAFSAIVVLFLAVTGMPWSMFWGSHVQDWATARGLGEPKPPAEVLPEYLLAKTLPPQAQPAASTHHHHDMGDVNPPVPWAMEQATPPQSQAADRASIGIDEAMTAFVRLNLARPFSVALPVGPRGAYMASYQPDRVEDTRVIYLDQYSGQVLADVGYAQYGPAAKAIEWGIAVHQGQEYGAANRYLMLAGCVAIVLMAVAAVTMWWKRRPRGAWGIPPRVNAAGDIKALIALIAIPAIIYPLVGLSIIAAWAIQAGVAGLRRVAAQ